MLDRKEMAAAIRQAILALEDALDAPKYVIKNPVVAGQLAAAVIASIHTNGANDGSRSKG